MITSTALEAWEECQNRGHASVAVRLAQLGRPEAPREQLANLPIGHRDHLLITFYERSFGREIELHSTCPSCSEELEVVAQTEEFRARFDVEGTAHELFVDPYLIAFRLPSSVDVAAACVAEGNVARHRALWSRCVKVTKNGEAVEFDDIPYEVRSGVDAQMSRIDAQAVTQLDIECPECSAQWEADFDVVPVLWKELDNSVRRQLFDIHQLAQAYGWNEDAVLALGPARRQFYLSQL